MPPTSLPVSKVIADYPQFAFVRGEVFKWSPSANTIYHTGLTDETDAWSLLHELGHALLGHNTYISDVALLQYEALAWERAQELAKHYGCIINIDYIEDHLDTYRSWLHERSTCPTCGQNGIQTKNTYSCINCRCVWRANEARICGLRRVRLQDQGQIS